MKSPFERFRKSFNQIFTDMDRLFKDPIFEDPLWGKDPFKDAPADSETITVHEETKPDGTKTKTTTTVRQFYSGGKKP